MRGAATTERPGTPAPAAGSPEHAYAPRAAPPTFSAAVWCYVSPGGGRCATASTAELASGARLCYYGDSCAATAPSNGGTATDLYSTTRPPSEKDPTGEVTTETYTPTGKPTTTTTPAVTTADSYDAAGDLTGVTYSTVAAGYAGPSDVTSTYNPTGTLATTTTATGTTTDSYDEAGDLTSQSFVPATGLPLAASAVSYAYTPTGKTKSLTYPSYGSVSDPTVTYGYDTAGQMTSTSDWLGHTTTFADDDSGNLTSTAFPNSTSETETYDTTGEATGISLTPNAHPTTPLAGISYARNATEQVTGETDTGALSATPSYGYDKSGRLSTSTGSGVGYTTATEPATLPTGASATYDQAGELTSSTKGTTTTSFGYDSLGDRTTVTPPSGPTTDYGYNALGQMTSATSTAATGPLSGTGVAFTYGATGLPAGKTTNAGATTTLVWDTAAASPELLTDGATDFVYGPTGRAVEQVDTTTTAPTYLVQDQLGSTRLLTDQAGTVVGTYGFDAYGNVTSHTGTATSPIGYAGGFETATTGLVNFDHRWLTTGTTSWLTVDPLVATTTAPYTYSTNDPTNLTDPSGQGVCVGLVEPIYCTGSAHPSCHDPIGIDDYCGTLTPSRVTPSGRYMEYPAVTGTATYCQAQCGSAHPEAWVLVSVVTYWDTLESSLRPTEAAFTIMLHFVVESYDGRCGSTFDSCVENLVTRTLGATVYPTKDNSINWWALSLKDSGYLSLETAAEFFNDLGDLTFIPSSLGSYQPCSGPPWELA